MLEAEENETIGKMEKSNKSSHKHFHKYNAVYLQKPAPWDRSELQEKF